MRPIFIYLGFFIIGWAFMLMLIAAFMHLLFLLMMAVLGILFGGIVIFAASSSGPLF